MQESYRESIIPEPVSSQDIEALSRLAETYKGLVDNNVRTVRQDSVPELIETSNGLADRITAGLGGVAASETVIIGVLPLSEEEKEVLAMSRRIRPTILS